MLGPMTTAARSESSANCGRREAKDTACLLCPRGWTSGLYGRRFLRDRGGRLTHYALPVSPPSCAGESTLGWTRRGASCAHRAAGPIRVPKAGGSSMANATPTASSARLGSKSKRATPGRTRSPVSRFAPFACSSVCSAALADAQATALPASSLPLSVQ